LCYTDNIDFAAEVKAGYSGNNHAQAVEGQRLLTNADIRARVEKRREEAMRRAQLHIDELVGRL